MYLTPPNRSDIIMSMLHFRGSPSFSNSLGKMPRICEIYLQLNEFSSSMSQIYISGVHPLLSIKFSSFSNNS